MLIRNIPPKTLTIAVTAQIGLQWLRIANKKLKPLKIKELKKIIINPRSNNSQVIFFESPTTSDFNTLRILL